MFEVWQGIPGINPEGVPASTWERGQVFVFSTFQTLDDGISKNIPGNPCGFIRGNKKGPLNKCAKFHWNKRQMQSFENSQLFSFPQNVVFWNSNCPQNDFCLKNRKYAKIRTRLFIGISTLYNQVSTIGINLFDQQCQSERITINIIC